MREIHRVEHECVARRNPLWSRFCLRSGGRRLARGGLARCRSRAGVTRGQERRSRRDRSIVGWGFIGERGLVGSLDGKRRCHRPTVCRWGFAAGRARRGRSSSQAEPAAARKRFGRRRPRGRFGCRLTSGRSRIRRSRRIGAPRRCARPCVRSRRTAAASGRPGRGLGAAKTSPASVIAPSTGSDGSRTIKRLPRPRMPPVTDRRRRTGRSGPIGYVREAGCPSLGRDLTKLGRDLA